jgi:hypothetical protein
VSRPCQVSRKPADLANGETVDPWCDPVTPRHPACALAALSLPFETGPPFSRIQFRAAFKASAADAGYLWYFDGDGDVDGHDNGQFNRRFGQF